MDGDGSIIWATQHTISVRCSSQAGQCDQAWMEQQLELKTTLKPHTSSRFERAATLGESAQGVYTCEATLPMDALFQKLSF